MTRTLARLAGFSAGYLFVILLGRVVIAAQQRQDLEDLRAAVLELGPARPRCACSWCAAA